MDWDMLLDEILATDDKIRYVAILDPNFNSVMSKARDIRLVMRKKVDADDYARTVLRALSQLNDNCGNLISAGAQFDLITLVFFRMRGMTVVVSAEPVPPLPIMKKLEQRFLTVIRPALAT